MTSIEGFIRGINHLDSSSLDKLVATVTDNDFGASLEEDCMEHHLQELLEMLPDLTLTRVQRRIIKNALDDAINGKLFWAEAAQPSTFWCPATLVSFVLSRGTYNNLLICCHSLLR